MRTIEQIRTDPQPGDVATRANELRQVMGRGPAGHVAFAIQHGGVWLNSTWRCPLAEWTVWASKARLPKEQPAK